MAGKPKRMSQIKQLLSQHKEGLKIKTIARNLDISRNTVKSYLSKYKSSKCSSDTLLKMEDPVLEAVFHPGNPAYKDDRFEVLKSNLDYYEKELARIGVSKKLLWEEYRQQYPQGYSLSQFSFHLFQHLLTKKPSLPLQHNAGEKLFVDFAGKTLEYIDKDTGEVIKCQVFVACLPYSDYSFAMAVPSQKVSNFIYALTCCLNSIGGAPKVLVPDNLKSAVVETDKYEPKINVALEDFANHYEMLVVPARVRKPKDKALVENQVRLIYNRVYAKLRNQQFFSLYDLNQAIMEKIRDHNQTRMQEKNYCREECFLSEEKPLLQVLAQDEFELKYYKEYKVATNNHIRLTQDKHYYSVPYVHIGQQAKVIYTRSLVRIYVNNQQVAVHVRDYRQGGYTTEKEHLCSTHQYYLSRSPAYYQNRAKRIDAIFYQYIINLFQQNRYPEQLYRSCDGIFSLQKHTDLETFTKACKKAIQYKNYSYRFLKNVINNRMTEEEKESNKKLPEHDNIRGKSFFQKYFSLIGLIIGL